MFLSAAWVINTRAETLVISIWLNWLLSISKISFQVCFVPGLCSVKLIVFAVQESLPQAWQTCQEDEGELTL